MKFAHGSITLEELFSIVGERYTMVGLTTTIDGNRPIVNIEGYDYDLTDPDQFEQVKSLIEFLS